MKLITKFTVASDQGLAVLSALTRELTLQKFSSLADQGTIAKYISEYLDEKSLRDEVNSLSNQWLVVYADNIPVGYARITSKGRKPGILAGARAIRIADFGVLDKYPDPAIRDSLFEKCLSVCKGYEGIWINEYPENPLIEFFESRGFTRQQGHYELDQLPLASVCLVGSFGKQ